MRAACQKSQAFSWATRRRTISFRRAETAPSLMRGRYQAFQRLEQLRVVPEDAREVVAAATEPLGQLVVAGKADVGGGCLRHAGILATCEAQGVRAWTAPCRAR